MDDAAIVADLQTVRMPDDPLDGVMVAYWWAHSPSASAVMRLLAEEAGQATVFVAAGHDPWDAGGRRYGWLRTDIHPRLWDANLFRHMTGVAESWLRTESAQVAVAKVRADFENELRELKDLAYSEVRRERFWDLDLVARRDDLLAGAERTRAPMRSQGIRLMTLDQEDDPETLRLLYELDLAATGDIPTTVPIYMPPFDEWERMYFENPGTRKDRFWIARLGAEVIGMSLIEYPPGRGIPKTWFTGTSPRHRGLGIARALKYETVAQAIGVGATRLRTDNDSTNAPILHLNAEMGYQPMTPYIELHRDL
jgi:GNAT superfamily N-acetyltransferase